MSNENSDLIGRVASSNAGRDEGRSSLIIGIIDEQYVYTADGEQRCLDRPKRKKLKHLSLQPVVAESIKAKLIEGKKVFDAEIRSCLLTLGYKDKSIKEEG